jgi:hypothetical protein
MKRRQFLRGLLGAGAAGLSTAFEEPEQIHPTEVTVPMTGASLVYEFLPASGTRLEITPE